MTDEPPAPGAPPPAAPPPPRPQTVDVSSGSILASDDVDAPALVAAPGTATDADLAEAVGARPSRKERKERKKRDRELEKLADQVDDAGHAPDDAEPDPVERDEQRGRRRSMTILAISIVVGVVITAFIVLGRINHDDYYFACSATEIRAEQGRTFPPWGATSLGGPEWKPIAIPPNVECQGRSTEDVDTLRGWYLAALLGQAETRLQAKDVPEVDLASTELEQALLLTRGENRRDDRKRIERLQGDVEYWRAMARLRSASTTLDDAAKQFETAAARAPRYITDADAWAEIARRAAATLGAGPGGLTATPAGTGSGGPTRVPPPVGVALPVEGMPDAAPGHPTVETPPDAGLPAGGVLL